MFDNLTYAEWDTLCTMMEKAITQDIPRTYPTTEFASGPSSPRLDEGLGIMDDVLDLHGDLMMRPTKILPFSSQCTLNYPHVLT